MKFYLCYPYAFIKKRDQQKSLNPLQDWLIDNSLCKLKQIIMRINLILFFIALAMFKVTASVKAQTINLKFENAPIEKVFSAIEKQSGYIFWYDKVLLKSTTKINLKITNGNLKDALDQCFKDQPLEYQIVENTIVVKQKSKIKPETSTLKSIPIKGKISDGKKQPLPGVTIKVKGTNNYVVSNNEGEFIIEVADENAVLVISYLGMETMELSIRGNFNPSIVLRESTSQLDGVTIVNTGYQQIPKERATGSFVQIDNELFNRRIGTSALDRLDGISSGLIFNKANTNLGARPRNETTGISIRGRSTIDAKVSADPLIILDNFPYEGDVSTLNPNDIESITILKDAAAASIWGARSGNGVIVITSKKGKFNQSLKVDLNANVTVGKKPDIFYSKSFLDAPDFIDLENYLFDQGFYNSNLNNTTTFPLISPAVEIFAKRRAGTLSIPDAESQLNALRGIDVRNEQLKYLFSNSVRQQYSVNLNGGSDKVAYAFASNYDRNYEINNNGYSRINLSANNIYRPIKNLELSTSIIYSKAIESRGFFYNPTYPYIKLADENGNGLTVPFGYRESYIQSTQALGFMDWKYNPLNEKNLVDGKTNTNNIVLKASARYNVFNFLNASIQYQFENQKLNGRNYQSVDTYYARNLINKFSQRSATGVFTYPFPKGGIVDFDQSELRSHNLRGQLNYNQIIKSRHSLNALAGAEIREISTDGFLKNILGYDDEYGTSVTNLNYNTSYPVNPTGLGSNLLPTVSGNVSGTVNRYISYYANGAYTLDDKYTFSLSGRKDGSNIFGVKTNDKITPLWSTGLSWEISKEKFYKFSLIPYLKLRGSYGFNGNVYNGSAYLTAAYSTSQLNGNQLATITSAPNAELRWEKVRNINLGVDFTVKRNILNGTIELFEKYGTDLIQDALLAPSTGFRTFKGNAASMRTKGIDLTINSNNLSGPVKWNTTLLASFMKDRIEHFDTKFISSYLADFQNNAEPASQGILPVEGNSLFGIYSYRWAGLDPLNGDPLGYLAGNVSKDYTAILSSTPLQDLVYHGSSRPTKFGSIRNTLTFKGFGVSFNITYKFDYFFRRRSTFLTYSQALTTPNADYLFRWQKTGDEVNSYVPSLTYATNANRNSFYRGAEILIEKGDHIRLQDLSFSYDIKNTLLKKTLFKKLELYSYINNIGIIWRSNKKGIDPDNPGFTIGSTPAPRTIGFGLRSSF